jgi:hypothetical protein
MEKLTLQNQMQHFRERWLTLPDMRKANNNTKYAVADGVLSAFAVFFVSSQKIGVETFMPTTSRG